MEEEFPENFRGNKPIPPINEIKGKKFERGKFYYRVIFENDPKKKLRWIVEEKIVASERGKEQVRQYNINNPIDKPSNPKNRIVEKIYGIVNDPSQTKKFFVVKFTDSQEADVVPRNFLVKHALDTLLAFYESNLEIGEPEKRTRKKISAKPQPKEQQEQPENHQKNQQPHCSDQSETKEEQKPHKEGNEKNDKEENEKEEEKSDKKETKSEQNVENE